MPEHGSLRVFLDANVVFSASRDEGSRLLSFWRMHDVTPVISNYVIGEVVRNVGNPDHEARLSALLKRTTIVNDADPRLIPSHVQLISKDEPILAAAIAASVDFLVTGDRNHFAHLSSKRILGVEIIPPARFLDRFEGRLRE